VSTIQIEEDVLRRLLVERDLLREQVSHLQRTGTELVETRRRESITTMVGDFHHKFGYPVRYYPVYTYTEAEVRFRATLITEEYFEAMRALLGPCVDASYKMIGYLINGSSAMPLRVDLPEFADALGDLDYVVEGTRLTLGIPRLAVAFEIQRANMDKTRTQLEGADAAKLGGWVKPMKPEGWKPPNIEAVLRNNGWLGESEPWRPRSVQSI
jgi:predicted HAD superfamily Cof-like phosphohydrolase